MKLRRHSFAPGAAALAACLFLSACGNAGHHSADSSDSTPTTAASASPTLSAADLAKVQVLAAYQGFWKVQEEAYSSGSMDGLPVNTYALGQAFYDIKATLQYYTSENLVMRGKPVLTPKVTALNVAKPPFAATITDCIDTTHFLPVDKTTGKPATTDHVFRHPWTFTASFDNVQWRIMTGKLDRSRTC